MNNLEVIAEKINPEVIDSNGRRLSLKHPNALAQYKLVDALGASAENRVYLTMCVPLLYLDAIDGERVNMPNSKMQVEAIIQRLDEPGLNALNDGIAEHFGTTNDSEEGTRAKK